MLSSELEYCLNEAFQKARDARHEYMTVEHLLLSVLVTPRVREILKACGADLTRLQADLQKFVDETTPTLAADDEREVQPTLGFQRVLQRAVFHVQSSSKKVLPKIHRHLLLKAIRLLFVLQILKLLTILEFPGKSL